MNLDSDEEVNWTINEGYATRYDKWRKKEELQKLKDKYNTDDASLLEESSSSSSEDEDAEALTNELEKDFLTTLGCLKKKDPKIYDDKVVFFKETDKSENAGTKKKKKEKPLYLRDYERKVIVEKEGKLSDEETDSDDNYKDQRAMSPTYTVQQKQLKESFKEVIDSEESDADDANLLSYKKKTEEEKDSEDKDYLKWLKGQGNLEDNDVTDEMKYLKNYWTNPSLDSNEKFLRDFIVNKKYLDRVCGDVALDPERLSEDEETMEKIEEFEHKFNFRFEEPDQEFIKRYPRTMTDSLRRTDTHRSSKRHEVKQRKHEEKERKMEDLKKMKLLKRQEIMEKLDKLKEITGNTDVGFNDADIEGDFDPNQHDQKMQELFNDDYYEVPEEEQKPEFSDDDEVVESWDNWSGYNNEDDLTNNTVDDGAPECEDPNFIMDADYDPNVEPCQSTSRSRRKKSKFAQALSKKKPVFDPNLKTFEEYFDEYYKLDYEDIIGDMPVRFKYRNVPANDFGLTTDEVILAKEKDLNRWCSLKKASQYRSEEEERCDFYAFKNKAKQIDRKRKLIPSLFEDEKETKKQKTEDTKKPNEQSKQSKNIVSTTERLENAKKQSQQSMKSKRVVSTTELTENSSATGKKSDREVKPDATSTHDDTLNESIGKKRKRKRNRPAKPDSKINDDRTEHLGSIKTSKIKNKSKKVNKNENPKNVDQNVKRSAIDITDNRLKAYGLNPKKFKNKVKYGKTKTN